MLKVRLSTIRHFLSFLLLFIPRFSLQNEIKIWKYDTFTYRFIINIHSSSGLLYFTATKTLLIFYTTWYINTKISVLLRPFESIVECSIVSSSTWNLDKTIWKNLWYLRMKSSCFCCQWSRFSTRSFHQTIYQF